MKYILEYNNYNNFDIWKIKSYDINLLGYNRDENGINWGYVEFSNMDIINRMLENFNYEVVEVDRVGDIGLTIHFTDPKRFEGFQASMHNYDPSDCYYTIRIYQYNDHWYVFQWFGQQYATQEHLERYYKKYPHFGPGGTSYTFMTRAGVESLCYLPPLYKGYSQFSGAAFGSADNINSYLCDQRDSLEHILGEFLDFLNDPSKPVFETSYPIYEG